MAQKTTKAARGESRKDIRIGTELKPNQLRWKCPVSKLKFKSTDELEPLDKIVGQPRAIESIRLGAELLSKGYNIFVSGLSGTGRLTTVRKILREVTSRKPVLFDFCYVHNFKEPDRPRLIKLSAGEGCKFASAMEEAVSFTKRRIPKLFEEEAFQKKRNKIIEQYQKMERDILSRFDEKIEPHGFVRGQIENEQGISQPEIFPVVDNKPMQIDDIDQAVGEGHIDEEQAEEFRTHYRKYHNELFELARKGMKLLKEFRNAISENDKSAAEHVVSSIFDEISDDYDSEKVSTYIKEVKQYILDNLQVFVPSDNPVPQLIQMDKKEIDPQQLSVFEVNVVLDNSTNDCAPVIIETTPSYSNLFGNIERVFDNRGFWRSDFSKIKAGAVLRADQGYLIVSAGDLFSEPGVWQALKRVLLYDKLEIQPWDSFLNLSQSYIKPEPIEVNVKVIIIGGQTLYRMLYMYEKGFKKIFKINAQFDYEHDRDDDFINYYSRFIAKICKEENLPHCGPKTVAEVIEWAVEHAGTQNRITLKFSDVADIVREAAFYGRSSNSKIIQPDNVRKAIAWRRHRNDMLDTKIHQSIIEGDTLIDTEGGRVGQINGLTVYDTAIIMFGKPSRITATISAGTAGIVNIDRESEMSGAIHNKGVLIISGFLQEHFAGEKPMSLTASIAFEQTYGGIDGDSASAAEIYVLLSAIANVPIKQSLAVTGSVNQKGDIQPIGGVNEKIRGFYEICRDRGLKGDQGVIIPRQNVKDLMLCHEVIEAVKKGKFHIYSIETIEEGARLMMDIETGELQKDGKYPPETLYGKVETRLEELRENALEDEPMKRKKRKKQQ